MATCRSCGAQILWAKTESGRLIPLDPERRADGNLAMTGRQVRSTRQQLVPEVRYVRAGSGSHVTHFATCPNAAEHREAAR